MHTTNQNPTGQNPTGQNPAGRASRFYVSSPELLARIEYPAALSSSGPAVGTVAANPRPSDPAGWWRTAGLIKGTRLFVCGDLPGERAAFEAQLDQWRELGITHIVDAREEWSDEERVVARHPDITYHWVGTHDDGSAQPDEWFRAGVEAALEAMADPEAHAVVHCHMGVNRGPSLAFAVLLAMGWSPAAAAAAIRAARPVAAILYAENALDWWHRQGQVSAEQAAQQLAEFAEWQAANPVDVAWVISRIRRAEW